MRRILLKFVMAMAVIAAGLWPAQAHAYKFMVDGIAYNIIDDNSAEVTYTSFLNDNYSGFTEINIPAEVTYQDRTRQVVSIGKEAFGLSAITSITLPPTIKSIGSYAFRYCDSLATIALPPSLEKLEAGAFYGCTKLGAITIPASVTSIHEDAFSYCTAVKSIAVAEGNTAYDSRGDCNAIIETATGKLIAGCPSTVIPQGVTALGSTAFWGMHDLTAIAIPGTVRSIGAYTFCNTGLTRLELPASVTEIGKYSFASCPLEAIVVAQDNPTFDSREGCNAIIETATHKLVFGCKNTFIPNGVAIIGENAFYSTPITSISIPSSVWSIENQAFFYCDQLTSLTIPASVTNIGTDAFYCCAALEKLDVDENNPVYDSRGGCNAIIVTAGDSLIYGFKNTIIPEGVRAIGDQAFCAMPITTINLPASVSNIGSKVFAYCGMLTDIYSHIMRPDEVTCRMDAFNYTPRGCVLHVPAGTEALYKATIPWSIFSDIVPLTPEGDVTGDGTVDIADINAVINVMLDKDTSDELRARSDVTGDGTVDIADINAIINIMLGK